MKSVGELSQVCSQIVLKCFFLARIGRPDILWSVNKLAGTITKWTKACDKRLNKLISYIHHTCEYKKYCYVGNTAKQWRLGLFQDSDFPGDLEDSKSTSRGILCFFGSHTFCSNKLDVLETNFSFAQFNRIRNHLFGRWIEIGLDTSLDVWDLIVLVLGNIIQTHDRTGQPVVGRDTSHEPSQQSQGMINVLNNMIVFPQTFNFRIKKLCCIFKDNEAVIKMIIKGRSPTMRHVSRTHRVALDWLFDRINLDPKIQIKYVDTKNQLADMLTKRKLHV